MATLVLTKQFIEDKESKMKILIDDLYKDLADDLMLIEPETLDRHIGSLETNVLGPAAELNQTMACSSAEYYLTEPRMEVLQSSQGRDRFGEFVLKDVVRWRNANVSETHSAISCLFSGVYRKGMKKPDDLALVKPTVLVWNREAIDKLQEYKINYTLAQHTRQRSPVKAGVTPTGKISPSIPSSRSSPAKSSSDRHRGGFRTREGSISDSGFSSWRRVFGRKGPGNDRKTQDMSFSSPRPHHIRRLTEDKESRRTLSRDKERERHSTRDNTASTSSRQSSGSYSRPGITLTPGVSIEYPTQARTPTAQHESRLHVLGEGGPFLSDVKNFSGSPVPWEKSESSGSGSVANVLYNVGEKVGTVAERTTGRLGESMHLPRSPVYLGERHPNEEGFLTLQDQLRRKSLGPGFPHQ